MKKFIFIAIGIAMISCNNKNNTSGNQSDQTADPQEENQSAQVSDIGGEITISDPTSILYVGNYNEVVEDGSDAQLRMWAWEDDLQIKLDAFYDEHMHVKGKIDSKKAEFVDSTGVRLPIALHVLENGNEVAIDETILTFTKLNNGLYQLHIDFVNEPSETSVRNLMVDYKMFLTDSNVGHMLNWVPFNIDKDKIKLPLILPELNKCVLMPELWRTVNYIKRGYDKDCIAENELITIDDRNRFFSYAWGDLSVNLEGKYFKTADDKILLVIDQHDSTYEFDQNLRFFIIDPEKGMLTEEEAYNLVPKEYIDRNSIFQVRYATEGVVAVFDDGEGGLDAKTLKYNGKTFQ